jgi:hypothetical protein
VQRQFVRGLSRSILKFNKDSSVARHFGGGLFNFTRHHVDKDGNVWITDSQSPVAGQEP